LVAEFGKTAQLAETSFKLPAVSFDGVEPQDPSKSTSSFEDINVRATGRSAGQYERFTVGRF
jgi:hypothetical protein